MGTVFLLFPNIASNASSNGLSVEVGYQNDWNTFSNLILELILAYTFSLSGEGDDFISTWEEVHDTFDAMGLHENLLRGIYAYGE